MERDLIGELDAWRSSLRRKPLMLQGARQVGKTWLLKEFGNRRYENVAYFSLESPSPGRSNEYAPLFEGTRDPRRIADNLSLASGQPIHPGRTLLVLDEIQDCPAAVGALKYFYEDAPDLHVACAGSLLGVKLSRDASAFPAGKVTFLNLRPMSFSEFLRAAGKDNLDAYLNQLDAIAPIPRVFDTQLIEQLMRYFAVGGMPEAVLTWVETHDMTTVDQVLADLIDSYERDFAKHGGARLFAKISRVWNSLPAQLARENKRFVYGVVGKGARAREYEDAIQWLADAGLLTRVNRITAPGLPITAYDDPAAFKTYCADVGLLRRLSGLAPTAFGRKDALFSEFKGAFSENFALQELLGRFDQTPRYWTNDKPRHEVDFVAQRGNEIVPIEVKSGESVHSASLRYYARKYPDETGLRVRLSLRNLSLSDDLFNVPLYLAGRLSDLIAMAEG